MPQAGGIQEQADGRPGPHGVSAALPELLAQWISHRRQRLRPATAPGSAYIVGFTGAQGTGKTTLAARLAALLTADGLQAVHFSLDDTYKTSAERQELREACPYYRFRGPFGTHDVGLGLRTLRALRHSSAGGRVLLPAFDKSLHGGDGDRLPPSAWREVCAAVDVVILEGWCLGARPVAESELDQPLNEIEAAAEYDDSRGTFRRRINAELQAYQELFAELDDLVVLHVADLSLVYRWRSEQEAQLLRDSQSGMDPATVRQFVDYFVTFILESRKARAAAGVLSR